MNKKLSFGWHGVGPGPLPRRLAWLTLARLLFLTLALALVSAFYLHEQANIGSLTPRFALATLAVSFALAAVYASILRRGRGLELLADVQLVLDQVNWTVVAYLTGGATSGATSFYGLSCLVGASLTGMRGAAVAAISGAVCYGSLALLLQKGWLKPPPDQPAALYALSADEFWFYLLVNTLVLVVVSLLSGTLVERLRRTGGALVAATERADRAERMAALGRLAAGLAHEIRNPLGSIAGSIQLLRTARGLSQEDRRLCEIIQREAARLNDLVTDMVDLSRPRLPMLADVDVGAIAKEVVELASGSGRAVSDVAIQYLGLSSAKVRADGAQLRQLIWNLVRNAVQASEPGAVVLVQVELDQRGHVELRVTDRGKGIDESARERLFDAFFTTRSQGTGVGLAVVKRIADEHHFPIRVESQEGQGASFVVVLAPEPSASQPVLA
ncbi:MAG TPA: ATP-binding protein [Polyangiaceae bacterium]|nr:ATP-binding protein [Polyangiaceae bacterium]